MANLYEEAQRRQRPNSFGDAAAGPGVTQPSWTTGDTLKAGALGAGAAALGAARALDPLAAGLGHRSGGQAARDIAKTAVQNVRAAKLPGAPQSIMGRLGALGALGQTAYDTATTPTEDYRKRFGLETNDPSLLGDVGVRALGAASDLGNAISFGLASKLYRDKQDALQAAAAPAAFVDSAPMPAMDFGTRRGLADAAGITPGSTPTASAAPANDIKKTIGPDGRVTYSGTNIGPNATINGKEPGGGFMVVPGMGTGNEGFRAGSAPGMVGRRGFSVPGLGNFQSVDTATMAANLRDGVDINRGVGGNGPTGMTLGGAPLGFRLAPQIQAGYDASARRNLQAAGLDPASLARKAELQKVQMQEGGANQRSLVQALLEQQKIGLDQQRVNQAAETQGIANRGATMVQRMQEQIAAEQDATKRGSLAQRLMEMQGKSGGGNIPIGYRTRADRTGLEPILGGPADPSTKSGGALNDTQAKALQFGTRMQQSGKNMDDLAAAGVNQPGYIKRAADALGVGVLANWTQSPEQQQVEQSQRDFVNAVLRRESGAAISNSEFDNARRQYFPQPGDSPQVIEQKRQNRELATRGMLAEVPDSERRVQQVVGQPNQGAPGSQPTAVQSQEAWQQLPSGAMYVAPDGSVRRKK